MAARHFLCCLPLRLGALLISVAQLLLCGLIAAGSFYTLRGVRGRLPQNLKGIVLANGIYYSILTVAALVGFIGTLGRKARLLSTYAFYLSWSVGVQLVIDGIYLWAFFSQSRQSLIDRCIDGSTDQDVRTFCNNSFNTGKWNLVAGIAIGLIIQLWAAYIVTSYAKKLKETKLWRSGPGIAIVPVANPAASGPRYAHVKQDDHESNIPLTNAAYSYPYKDSSHSFGARV